MIEKLLKYISGLDIMIISTFVFVIILAWNPDVDHDSKTPYIFFFGYMIIFFIGLLMVKGGINQ